MESHAVSLVSDIRVKRKSISVIRPAKRRERYSLCLTNIDQILVGHIIKYVHFFSGSQEIAFDSVVYLYKKALGRSLFFYEFISGRLTLNSKQRRFEIDCNAAGVPFAVCTSELTLEEMGDIAYPNPAFAQLCLLPGSTNQLLEDEPLMSFQVTQFRCGGFAVGTVVNHCLMDGFALQEFAKKFTRLAGNGDVSFFPVTHRTRLKARGVPLEIKYEHEELVKPCEVTDDSQGNNMDLLRNKMPLPNQSEKYVFQRFFLSEETLRLLELKVKQRGVTHCSSFIAALAFLWRARTAAMANINENDITTVHYVVDVRSRMRPPLPREYEGYGIRATYAKAAAKELRKQPFSVTVGKLVEEGNRLTDELHDGVTHLENALLVTSWSHMEYGDVEFVSVYAGPVICGKEHVAVFMTDAEDKAGIKICIGLEPSHVSRFQILFQNVDTDTANRSNM